MVSSLGTNLFFGEQIPQDRMWQHFKKYCRSDWACFHCLDERAFSYWLHVVLFSSNWSYEVILRFTIICSFLLKINKWIVFFLTHPKKLSPWICWLTCSPWSSNYCFVPGEIMFRPQLWNGEQNLAKTAPSLRTDFSYSSKRSKVKPPSPGIRL